MRFLPVDVVNAPDAIARNHHVVSINGALAVDLYGQVAADRLDGRQFSGIGGHEDFVAQSGLELGDRSLICLPSTAHVAGAGERVSRIVANLAPGTTVTTPRHQVDVVITEHGVAELRGRTMRERAVALAEIAHPDFRDELRATATTMAVGGVDERALDRPPRARPSGARAGRHTSTTRDPAHRRGPRRSRGRWRPRSRAHRLRVWC